MSLAGARSETVLNRALLLLAPAITIIVATEFIVVGLLPLISQDMQVPLAKAGQLTGWWAFSAAVAGPLVTLATSRLALKPLLIGTLLSFAVGNALMAFVSDFTILLVTRIVQGALLPAFIGVGAAIVTRLAKPDAQGKGLARANIGFVLGVLLALPAGVVLAQGGDWRLPFLVLAVLSLLTAALIGLFFPLLPHGKAPDIAGQLNLLRCLPFLANLALSVILFAAMFSVYTYLGAWIQEGLGLSFEFVALILLLLGVAGLVGNSIAGRIADDAPMRATVVSILILIGSINLAALAHQSILLATVPLALWGMSHTASVTLSQVRVTLAGRTAPAFAMTMNISAANLGIATGAFGGGWVIDNQGVNAIGIAPVGFAIIALLLAPLIARSAG